MSIFSSSNTPKNTGFFNMYDNQYIAPNPDTNQITINNVAIQFTTMLDFRAVEDSEVAEEPIENGSFTTDAVQNKATLIYLSAAYTPLKGMSSLADVCQDVQATLKQIRQYKEGAQLVTISMENPPMFDVYPNLKIMRFEHQLNANNTSFVCDMVLKMIRQSDTNLVLIPSDQVNQSNYASQVDNGQQIPNSNVSNNYSFKQ